MKVGFEASRSETLCFWEKKRNHLHSHQIFWGRPWKYYTEIVWHWISNGLSGVILVHTILCSFPTLFSGNKTEDWKFNWNIWNKFNWTTWKWRDKRSKLLCEEKPNVQVTLFSFFCRKIFWGCLKFLTQNPQLRQWGSHMGNAFFLIENHESSSSWFYP